MGSVKGKKIEKQIDGFCMEETKECERSEPMELLRVNCNNKEKQQGKRKRESCWKQWREERK